MSTVIQSDDLADVIVEELEKYNEEIEKTTGEECQKLAKEIKKSLENDNTIPQRNHAGKHYKKSFYIKNPKQTKGKTNYIVANRKFQLTHLLEKPHEIVGRDGKRKGVSRAFPHWEKAQKKTQELYDNIIKRLEGME